MNEMSTPAHQLPAGTLLSDKYEIIRTLGEGGFGITYMGRNTVLDIPVAIKEYYPHGYASRSAAYDLSITITDSTKNSYFSKWKGKFLNEARALAKFSNIPNIVKVHDFFEQNGTAYIVMEYLNGITLSDYISKNGVFDAGELCRIMIPMLKSLNKIHQKKLIHRDISPDNIMMMPDGSLKLYDFGAARDYSETTQRSLSVILKPGFAPEEQYRSHGIQGPWTDVYAVCATIYFCITSVRPDASIDRVFSDELKPPSELGICISPQIEEAILMGMSVKYEDRFRTAEALATAFERGLSVSEQTAPSKSAVKLFHRHSKADKNTNSLEEHTEIIRTEVKISEDNTKKKITFLDIMRKIAAKLNIMIVGGVTLGLFIFGLILMSTLVDKEMHRGDYTNYSSDVSTHSEFTSISIPSISLPSLMPESSSSGKYSVPDLSEYIDISSLITESSSSNKFEISVPDFSTSIDTSSLIPENSSSVHVGSLYPYLGSLKDTLPSTNEPGSSNSLFTETADRIQFKDEVVIKGSVSNEVYDAVRYSFQIRAGFSSFYSDYDFLNEIRSHYTEGSISDIEDVRKLYSGFVPTMDKCLSDLKVVKQYDCPNSFCSSYYKAVISLADVWEEYLQTLKQYSTVKDYITMNSITEKRKDIESRINSYESRLDTQLDVFLDAQLQEYNIYWKAYGKYWGEYSALFIEFVNYFDLYIDSINEFTPETMNKGLTTIQSYSSRLSVLENKMSGYAAGYNDQTGVYNTLNDSVRKAKTYVEACEAMFSSSSFDDEFLLLAERVDTCRDEVAEALDKAVALLNSAVPG